MSGGPVDPADVPVFTGDLDVLEAKAKALSRGGSKVQTAGSDVHKSFGQLAAFYKAPEAEQLFGVTKPVERTAHDLSDDMHVIAKALGTYANEIRPLIHRLKQLKQEAADFRDNEAAEDDWSEDGDLTDENLARRNKIAEVWAAFQKAESDCHAKIIALVPGGKALHTIDASHKNGYGYDAETLKASKSLPWGDAVEESVPWWQVWEHAYDFGKGFIVDGVGGTIDGVFTLFGGHGGDAAGEAWKGLAKLTTAFMAVTAPIVGPAYVSIPGKWLPSWLRDSRTAVLDTGKAFVAWDQWETNGSRAAGAVSFNVVTAVFTRGGGAAVEGAGKAGALAKGLSAVSKVGSAVDPMTYAIKGAGASLSKVSDVMARLKDLGHVEVPKISEGAFSLPEGAEKLPDGTIQLPKGAAIPEGATKLPGDRIELPKDTVTLPPNTVKDPFNGNYTDIKGDLYGKDGRLLQRAEDAYKEKPTPPTTGADNPRIEAPARQEQRVPAGVGGRGDDFARVGSDVPEPAHVRDNALHRSTRPGDNVPVGRAGGQSAPGGTTDNHMPTNNHAPSGSGSTAHTPGSGGPDNSTSGAGRTIETSDTGSGGRSPSDGQAVPHQGHGPIGTGGGHDLPGADGVDDLGHAGDEAVGNGPVPHEPESPILPGGSEARPDGARYVVEPPAEDAQAARFYDEIRTNPGALDIRNISENTGISTPVLDRVRTHFFLTQHVVAQAPRDARLAYFTPRSDIAEIWQAASKRTLTPEETIKFERYIAHEYVESHLIEAGVPYLRDEPHLWEFFQNPRESGYSHVWPERAADAGAHDLSLSERRGGFSHWAGFDLDVPTVELSPNLANIDEVIVALFDELRSKGIELK